jgi:hypothetical protein
LLAALDGKLDQSQKQEAEKVLADLARPPDAVKRSGPVPAR